MKKLGILLCLALCISACHRRIQTFYAYEDEHSYCTLEINMKKNGHYRYLTYRGMSKTHYDTVQAPVTGVLEPLSEHPRKNNLFIYVKGKEVATENYTGFDNVIHGFYYMKRKRGFKFDLCFPLPVDNKRGLGERYVLYERVTHDSLAMIVNELMEQQCFQYLGIDWFPPYLKRVKEIDYDKFQLPQVKNKHLKNPTKALLTDEDFEKIENTERSQKQ
ncbi:hypothetical protein AAG747_28165 [Rapidithrix thailandica]|uniref:Lipoprotein n=1 Tax=Rapidithrix thailandica TaxID=413964 RepID=A0AAW9SHR6_9BACT